MGLRNFIEQLQKTNELTKITKPVSTEYEMAGIIAANGEKPVYFENVKESSIPVVAGLVSSKELICRSMNITKEQLLPKLLNAIEQPVAPKMVEKASCQEVIHTDKDVDFVLEVLPKVVTRLREMSPLYHKAGKEGGCNV